MNTQLPRTTLKHTPYSQELSWIATLHLNKGVGIESELPARHARSGNENATEKTHVLPVLVTIMSAIMTDELAQEKP